MGGSWRIPVMEKLLKKSFVDELRMDGTYSDASFAREYESEWSGENETAYYSAEKFDKYRVLLEAEDESPTRLTKGTYYIIGVDVGRNNCTTEACIFKVIQHPSGTSIKSLVNIYTMEAEHFEIQAIELKKLYYRYNARRIVIDANGLGSGLVDFMTIEQTDKKSGEKFPAFGVYGANYEGWEKEYKKRKTQAAVADALYLIKANPAMNTEAHTFVQTQMTSGKLRFLIDEVQAKNKLLGSKYGKAMTLDQRQEYLRPYVLTTALKDQMMNLIEKSEGINIILKQNNTNIKKDKFSAFEYGLYYIKKEEEKKKKKSGRLGDLIFYS